MPRLSMSGVLLVVLISPGCFQPEHEGPLRIRVENVAPPSPMNLTLLLVFENVGIMNITQPDIWLNSREACSFTEPGDCRGGRVHYPVEWETDGMHEGKILNWTDVIPPGTKKRASVGIEFGPEVLSQRGYYFIGAYAGYWHGSEEWEGFFNFPCYDGELNVIQANSLCDTSR